MSASVSIIVPVYNVEAYLRQCLLSLVGQTLQDIQIVIVNDGSTDGSPAIIEEFASADSRIVVLNKANSGYGDSMNKGIEIATAPWIAICEPDDWFEPDFCESLLSEALRYEELGTPVDVVKAAYYRETHAQTGTPETLPCFYLGKFNPVTQPFTIEQCPDILVYHPSIWTCLYRHDFLRREDIHFKPIPGAGWADNPFFVETLVAAKALAYLDKPLYHYREFDDGTESHLKDWTIPVDRWFDILEVLKRRGATDTGVWACNYARGCAYLAMLDADFDAADPALSAAKKRMVESIDYDTVMKSPYVIEDYKKALRRHYPASFNLRKRFFK